ncbi:hypothetical protein CY0110_18582 [Crocosphaera chwakensis CCY0110]|uniref:Uncharacterized protein n=1 Tax=Crocosphaera chwakensis CCY0110 TaxID=391612 RepID=A3IJ48_9CHRO|nr:hypothetical protein CY0110_18582 [Crocosphaera chwakensis CCY0110]
MQFVINHYVLTKVLFAVPVHGML